MTSDTTQQRRWTWPRLTLLTLGAILALAGLGTGLVGATVLSQASEGAIDFGNEEIQTEAHTLVSEPLDWSAETYLGGVIERANFRVTTADNGAPIFVGLTTPQDRDSYLGDGDLVEGGFRFPYTEYASTSMDGLHESGVWTAEATGTGDADLAFNAAEQPDERVLVITNLDREPLHNVAVESYGSVPTATTASIGLIVGGVAMVAAAVALIVIPIRKTRQSA